MRQTVLDLVQEILSSLNSDEVNSIGDTTESLQVASIIRRVYYNIVSRGDLTIHTELFQLTPSTDIDKPVLMTVPEKVSKIEWIKYFNDDDVSGNSDLYQYVTILPLSQYLDYINGLDVTQSYVGTFTFTDGADSWTFRYRNDTQPCYCTFVSNNQIVFDGYDSNIDGTLQASKTLCFGQMVPVFEMEDTFIPDLDEQQFPLLLNEAKELAFFELKETAHPLATRESKRQWAAVQKNKSITDKPSYYEQLPNFGRKPYYRGIW